MYCDIFVFFLFLIIILYVWLWSRYIEPVLFIAYIITENSDEYTKRRKFVNEQQNKVGIQPMPYRLYVFHIINSKVSCWTDKLNCSATHECSNPKNTNLRTFISKPKQFQWRECFRLKYDFRVQNVRAFVLYQQYEQISYRLATKEGWNSLTIELLIDDTPRYFVT